MIRNNNVSSDIIAVFDEKQTTLDEFRTLLFDVARGELQDGVTKKEADEKICMMFNALYGFDKKPTIREAERALRKNPYIAFEVIEEVVPNLLQSGWDANPFMNEFAEIRNLAIGDTAVFYTEEPMILNVARLSADHWDMPRQRIKAKERFTVQTDAYGAAVYAEFARLMAGFESWSELVGMIAKAFMERMNNEVYAAFLAAMTQLPTQFQVTLDTTTPDLSREMLLTLVEDVERSTGYGTTIIGTKSGLAKLRKLDEIQWIANSMKEELYETGRQGLWYGVPLIELKQINKFNTTLKMFDDNKLMVLPRAENKFIKIVNEGEAIIREVNDGVTNQDMTSDYRYIQRFGVAVVLGLQFGAVTLQ